MKIAMMGHKRIPSREGGVEIVVEELAVRMAALGHDVTVYNRSGHHVSGKENEAFHYQKKFDYKGVHVVTVKTPQNKSLNAIVYSFFAVWQAVFHKYDVIHFHAEGPCSMIPIARLFGKKCIATIHGLDWKRAKWGGFATRFLLFGEKMAAKHANCVIVLSRNVQEYFASKYARSTEFIPNGITCSKQQPPAMIQEKYGLQGQDYILFLARIVPEKGLHYLIEAYEKSGISQKLVIAGGVSHSGEYHEQIQEMIHGNPGIIQTGFVQGRELEELYSNCLCYVLPSEIEGMPLSLLEAMSYGAFCLTSDIPENVEVSGEYALHFKSKDTADLERKLTEAVNIAPKRQSHPFYNKEKIQEKILSEYNWDDIVKRTLNCYENITGK